MNVIKIGAYGPTKLPVPNAAGFVALSTDFLGEIKRLKDIVIDGNVLIFEPQALLRFPTCCMIDKSQEHVKLEPISSALQAFTILHEVSAGELYIILQNDTAVRLPLDVVYAPLKFKLKDLDGNVYRQERFKIKQNLLQVYSQFTAMTPELLCTKFGSFVENYSNEDYEESVADTMISLQKQYAFYE